MLSEKQKRDFYESLDENEITAKTEKYKMLPDGYRIETTYCFDTYEINHTTYSHGNFVLYIIKYDKPDSRRFKTVGKYNSNENEHFKQQNQHIYDMYVATKNKSEGKPYINPYGDNVIAFSIILDENNSKIFPDAMPIDRRIEAMNELKQVLHHHIAQYRERK